MRNIKPLHNEADYDWALREIERYFDKEPEPGSAAADRFDVLAALIAAYEDAHWSVAAPDAVSAIKYRMQLDGLSQADLARLLGSKSRASEILRGKRDLTLEQAFKLHKDWRIPAESLLLQADI